MWTDRQVQDPVRPTQGHTQLSQAKAGQQQVGKEAARVTVRSGVLALPATRAPTASQAH